MILHSLALRKIGKKKWKTRIMIQIFKCLTEERKEYQPIPFWSWNDRLDKDKLIQQIRWMKACGIGGFFMHARSGLKTTYLSQEWMECIEACCDEARALGMQAWAYDENGWPSGFVGGKLLENPENHDMYIEHQIGEFDESADIQYLLTKDSIIRTSKAEEGKEYLNLYLRYSTSSVDILNPRVVEQFIEETHEKYSEYFGEKFSKKLAGFFTDEPQYYRYGTSYTPMMEMYYQEQYGQDINDYLGLLFVEKEGYRAFRYRYWLSMQKLMLKNFAEKIYTWCLQHGVKFTGHYVEEISMGNQIMCCGGVMPFYEYESIPGIDWLGRETNNELSIRQIVSASKQLGKKIVMSETFGCCGWDVTPEELRRIAGFQCINGVNMLCHHLVPYSERGLRKYDYPAHFHPINPWIKDKYLEFNQYFSRMGNLVATSEEIVHVAMLHPIRSAYLNYKRGKETYETEFELTAYDAHLRASCRQLSSEGIGYHFLDETLLEKHGFVEDDVIGCGQCRYHYLVFPKVLTMGKHTEKLIKQFVQNGGKVLLFDGKPEYLEGEPYSFDYLASNCSLEEIKEEQPFTVEKKETELYYSFRKIKKEQFLLVQNGSATESYTQTFRLKDGANSFTSIDLLTFNIETLPLTITIPPNASLLLVPTWDEVVEGDEMKKYDLVFDDAEVDFEENYLTMDLVTYSTDGKTYSSSMYRSELFQLLLKERYAGPLWIRYEFEVRKLPGHMDLIAELEGVEKAYLNGHLISFAHTLEEEDSFSHTEIASQLKLGNNFYEIQLNWKQKEDTYYALFGENVMENLRNCIDYESEISPVYLKGNFGVYSVDGFEDYDEETVCAHHFYIGEKPEKVSELTQDGLTFFRGKLKLKQTIHLSEQDVVLAVKGRYLTANVTVNGEDAGELFFEKQLDISKYAKKGENTLEILFTIGNRNMLGPHHFCAKESSVSPGVFASYNIGKSKEGHPRYRFYRFYKKEELER